MTRSRLLLTAAAIGLVGCSSESTRPERPSTATGSDDAGAADAAAADALAPGEPDPNQGRDDDPASCFAACSNTEFTCEAGAVITFANMTPDSTGCSGTLVEGRGTASEESYALKLVCGAKEVCLGDASGGPATACVPGMYSATSFAYTPAGGVQNVCIRD